MYTTTIGSIFANVVTWALVILGWAVVADQQRSEERRRHSLSKIDALKDRIVKLENVGVDFHTIAFDELKSVTIVRELHRVALELRYLKFAGALSGEWVRLMVNLRQALTLRNFDKSSYVSHPASGDVPKNITSAGNALSEFLLNAQLSAFGESRTLLESAKSVLSKARSR